MKRLNSVNDCYLSFLSLLFSCLLSKNLKVSIHITINVACGSVWMQKLISDIKGWI
jgi:hypothetical protein